MTIEEKRKALNDFCSNHSSCEGCVLYSQNCGFKSLDDAKIETTYAIAFGQGEEIESLKAENERLSVENERLNNKISIFQKLLDKAEERIATARADAIMDFANRLCADYRDAYTVYGIEGFDDVMIMSIAKEMTEDKK